MPNACDGQQNKKIGITLHTITRNSLLHPVNFSSTNERAPHTNPTHKLTVSDSDLYVIHTDNAEGISQTTTTLLCLKQGLHILRDWYLTHLKTYPIVTKSLTAGFLASIGDVSAQLIEFGSQIRDGQVVIIDTRRVFAMFIEGSCFSGPLLHFVFNFYEYLFPIGCVDECYDQSDISTIENGDRFVLHEDMLDSNSRLESTISTRQYLNAFLHVAFDQIVMAFPYVGGMMIVTGLVEGHRSSLVEELQKEYLNNVRASWIAALGLAPFQFFAFTYLPINWRVLSVNLQDVVWIMVMSYVTHRTREVSEPFFDFETDDFYSNDDLFSSHHTSRKLHSIEVLRAT